MGRIKFVKVLIKGLYVKESPVHGDSCGYFVETYNQNDMHEVGLDLAFVQDNQNISTRGVLAWTAFPETVFTGQTGKGY